MLGRLHERDIALDRARAYAQNVDGLLRRGNRAERRVGELEELLDIQQPTLSQQLAVLRDESLVETRREGKQIFYRITSDTVLAVLAVLYQQYCAPPEGDSA